MIRMLAFAAALLVALTGIPAMAAPPDVPQEKQTKLGKYLTAREAHDAVQANRAKILFIDTRTRAEVAFVGMTSEVDANVPYVDLSEFWDWDDKAGRFKLEPNANFGQAVAGLLKAKGLTRDDRIIFMCRSGDRSARATNLLADLGYTNVWSIVDGFEGDLSKDGRRTVNGWKNANLPWGYTLDKAKMYLPLK